MEQFNGKYQIVKSENYPEYLAAIGVVKDKSQAPSNDKTTIELAVNGNQVVITSSAHSYAPTLVLNEEVEDKSPDGELIKTVLKLDGGNLVAESKLQDGTIAKRTYSLSGSDLTLKLSSSKADVPEAVLSFKKL